MIVIRFFDKLFTVVKERTCNWDSIVGVYLLLVPTIYNLTSHLKYSYRNLTTKKPDRNNKNKLITLHMSQIIIPQKVLLLFSKIAVGRPNYLHNVTTVQSLEATRRVLIPLLIFRKNQNNTKTGGIKKSSK